MSKTTDTAAVSEGETNEATQVAPQPIVVVSESSAEFERRRGAEYLATLEEAKRLKMDQSVPGGRFLVNGVLVDANGQPITES